MFNIGDQVVHKRHGIGTIVRIEARQFEPGTTSTFYIMEIEDCGAPKKIFIPVNDPNQTIRTVTNSKDLDAVFDVLKTQNTDYHQTWNRRYREYMEKVNTGNINDLASVVRSVWQLKVDKDLSFGERQMFQVAFDKLAKEIAAIKSIDIDQSETLIREGLK